MVVRPGVIGLHQNLAIYINNQIMERKRSNGFRRIFTIAFNWVFRLG